MIGVFDSGDGGLSALREIRCIIPNADIAFLADRKNAPYGTKTEDELIRLVSEDIDRLKAAGASRILMACCTASTVYERLARSKKALAVPIISPAAREAANATRGGSVGVIATEQTVRSRAFGRELRKFGSVKNVYELPLQWLVCAVDGGMRDGRITERERRELRCSLAPMREYGIDTLILGCTHFSHLEREISSALPGVRTVSPAREGAKEITKCLSEKGKGRTIYLE